MELVAYDERYAIYIDPKEIDALHTVRRDKKKLTQKDRKEVDRMIEFLLTQHLGSC